MKKKKLNMLVTGSNGQVGQELQALAKSYPGFDFVFVDVAELDITNMKAVEVFFTENTFDYCLNCAAYTAVDKAETEHQMAWKVNAQAVKILGEACKKKGVKLLQLSTDYVYHNSQNTPFKEIDQTNPQSIYAATKLEGDNMALSAGGMVIRTSWLYSSFGNNFVKTMLRLGSEQPELSVIFDQIGTPTYARDLAKAMLDVLQLFESQTVAAEKFCQVYHYSNEGVTSWYDLAKAVFAIKNIEVKVNPVETKDFPTAAKRPPYSVLNKAKFKSTFGLEVPHWQESLRECLKLM